MRWVYCLRSMTRSCWRDVVVLRARGVRLRVELEQLLGGRRDAVRRNAVARKRLAAAHAARHRARRRIEQLAGVGREIARPHRHRGHGEGDQERLVVLVAFPVRHEEQPVLGHRAAGRVAELMPAEVGLGRGGLGGGEGVGAGVELLVAVELEDRAVKGVRARLGDHVHLTRGAAELGRVDARLHLEFFQRVHRREKDVGVEVDVGVVHAVERVVVELAPLARNRDLLVGARAALAIAGLAGAGEPRAHVRAERDQAEVVAAVERQLDDAPVLDDRADRRVLRREERRRRR